MLSAIKVELMFSTAYQVGFTPRNDGIGERIPAVKGLTQGSPLAILHGYSLISRLTSGRVTYQISFGTVQGLKNEKTKESESSKAQN